MIPSNLESWNSKGTKNATMACEKTIPYKIPAPRSVIPRLVVKCRRRPCKELRIETDV